MDAFKRIYVFHLNSPSSPLWGYYGQPPGLRRPNSRPVMAKAGLPTEAAEGRGGWWSQGPFGHNPTPSNTVPYLRVIPIFIAFSVLPSPAPSPSIFNLIVDRNVEPTDGGHMAKMSAFRVDKIKKLGFHRDGGDGAARGLYLQVAKMRAGGLTKSWVYRYVSPVTGKPRWMGLGPADAIGLAAARDLAKAARTTQKLGGDPIELRRQQRIAARLDAAKQITFGRCAVDYVATHKASWGNKNISGNGNRPLKAKTQRLRRSMICPSPQSTPPWS
jgi:Arm DNA-binding domain